MSQRKNLPLCLLENTFLNRHSNTYKWNMDVLYWKNEAINQGYVYVPYVKMLCADGTFVDQPLEVVTDMDELQGDNGCNRRQRHFLGEQQLFLLGFLLGQGCQLPGRADERG